MLQNWLYIFPSLFNLIIIVVLNRYYFRTYRLFPFKIEINTEKMICSDYFDKSKVIEIKLSDINDITGGVLSGTPAKPIYIYTKNNETKVGISPNLKNSNKLVTIILSNISKSLYEQVLARMEELNKVSLFREKKSPSNKRA